MKLTFITLFLLSLILSFNVYSEEKSTEKVELVEIERISLTDLFAIPKIVTSMCFFNVDIAKAPNTTILITQDQIDLAPIAKLEDLFNYYAPSVTVAQHARNLSLFAFRGIKTDNTAKTLFMVNGMNINQRSHGFCVGMKNQLFGDYNSIEVIAGPGAILHGSGAINGFVNFIPKTGKTNPGLNIKARLGATEKLGAGEIGYGFSYGENKDLYLYGGFAMAKGIKPKDDFYEEYFLEDNADPNNRNTLAQGYPEPNFKISTNWNHKNLKTNLFFERICVHHNSNSLLRFCSRYSFWKQSILGFGPSYTLNFTDKESLELKGTLTIHDFAHVQDKRSIDSIDHRVLGGSETHYEGKVIFRTTRLKRLLIAAGGLFGYRQFYESNQFLGKQTDHIAAMGANTGSWLEYAGFAEFVVNPFDPWDISVGARFDGVNYNTIESKAKNLEAKEISPQSKLSMRVATNFEITPEAILKASFQQGFHSPDANDFIWYGYINKILKAGGYQPMPDFQSESMNSYEVGFSHKILPIKLSWNLNYYFSHYKNLIEYIRYHTESSFTENINHYFHKNQNAYDYVLEKVGGGGIGSMNNHKEDLKTTGAEIGINWIPGYIFNLVLSYSLSFPVSKDKGRQIINEEEKKWVRFPTHMVKTNITSYLYDKKLAVNLALLFHSELPIYYDMLPLSGTNYFKNNMKVSTKIAFKLMENLTMSLSAVNIFGNSVPAFSQFIWSGNLGLSERMIYIGLELHI